MELTPEQWRDKLASRLASRRKVHRKYRDRYDGIHPLPVAPNKDENFRRLVALSDANMCANIIDAVTERLTVLGVSLNDGDTEASAAAWRQLWKEPGLEVEVPLIIEEAVKATRSFALVWPTDDGVEVTAEDPDEVIVAYAAGSRRHREAALKMWNDAGTEYAWLTLPETLHYWQRSKGGKWEPWDGPDGAADENPLGAVPFVEFRSRPKLNGDPVPELSRGVLRSQDRLNKRLFDSVIMGEHQAFPQRVAIGIEIKTDAEGNPVNPLKSGPERVWALQKDPDDPNGSAQVFQLDAADLRQHIDVVEFDIRMLATQSKTPLYELAGQLVNVAGDTVAALNVGHVKKVMRHQRAFGLDIVELFRLIADARDDVELGDMSAVEVRWADPELRTLSEKADAATKLSSVGYPFQAVAETMGESDARIEELLAMREAEQLRNFAGLIPHPTDPAQGPPVMPVEEITKRTTALGTLIRAGVDPESAADQVGLSVDFIEGAVSTSVRLDSGT